MKVTVYENPKNGVKFQNPLFENIEAVKQNMMDSHDRFNPRWRETRIFDRANNKGMLDTPEGVQWQFDRGLEDKNADAVQIFWIAVVDAEPTKNEDGTLMPTLNMRIDTLLVDREGKGIVRQIKIHPNGPSIFNEPELNS